MVLEMTSFRLFLLALCSFCFALPLPLALPFCVASSFCSCFGYASRLRSCCSSGAALFYPSLSAWHVHFREQRNFLRGHGPSFGTQLYLRARGRARQRGSLSPWPAHLADSGCFLRGPGPCSCRQHCNAAGPGWRRILARGFRGKSAGVEGSAY